MKKIDFKQPKYIIPLIVLPFAFLINFLVLDMTNAMERTQEAEYALKSNEGISLEMPEPSKKSQGEISDKFDSFSDLFKDRRDMTAIQEIDREELMKDDFESVYSDAERKQIDSLNRLITEAKRQKNIPSPVQQQPSYDRNKYAPKKEDEMETFKKQMLFIDSLTSSRYKNEVQEEQDDFLSYVAKMKEEEARVMKEQEEKLQPVKKADDKDRSNFNTIMANEPEQLITAILDEGLKVYDGSRVRIRLLDDITIGQHYLEKNTILYGIISGFSAQRVKVTISSVFLKGNIIPVNISVYDRDGMEGVYVPANTFREFVTEVGARGAQGGNQVRVQQDPQSQNAFLYSMLDNSVRTVTQATSKELRRRKANFKYSTHIYLLDNSTN